MSFFGKIAKSTLDKVYDAASKIDGAREKAMSATHSVNKLIKGKSPSANLKAGNIIQFMSRSSQRTIQIVVSRTTNELICDAIGGTGAQYANAQWKIITTKKGHYFFHNNYNYLGIANGKIIIIPSLINNSPPVQGEFLVHDVLGSTQAIYIESAYTPGYYLAFNDDGSPADAFTMKSKDRFSQFETYIVTYGPGIEPEHDEPVSDPPPPPYLEAVAASNHPSSVDPK